MYWIPASSIMKANPPCSLCTFSTPSAFDLTITLSMCAGSVMKDHIFR
jgi:hypothetical protein